MSHAPGTRAVWSFLRSFRSDERGASLILFGLAIPILVGVAGLAIDYSRAASVQSRVQQAADAAALASVALVRNGVGQDVATSVAQSVFAANLGGGGGAAPTVQFSVAGTQYTASVSGQGSIGTTLGRVLGLASLPAGANATAMALQGPSGGGSMSQNFSGVGSITGDPHTFYQTSAGVQTYLSITCVGGSWYNLLSDAGVQWNSTCLNDGSSLFFGGSTVQVGTHRISYMPYLGAGLWQPDQFANDCITISGLAGAGVCNMAYAASLVVDGQTIDPTSGQFAGMTTFTALNDTAQGIVVTVQMSNNALPAQFGAVPAGVFNYLAVDVKTPNYEILVALPYGFQNAYSTVNNGGMCGSPGGYFGSFINGTPATDPAPYVVPGPTYQGGQFVWTAMCGNTGGQIAHLIQ